MGLPFTKMHGIGNDYIFVDAFAEHVRDPSRLARRISDRHFGVGGDGLILIRPPYEPANDCRMEMYNADGSRAQMCGNGIRCVARYVHDHGIATRRELKIETDAGTKRVLLEATESGIVDRVTVDMGPPGLRRRDLPMDDGEDADEPAIGRSIEVADRSFLFTAVSMGNPHVVVRIDGPGNALFPSLDQIPLDAWGPLFELHPWFPERTNTEFVSLRSRSEMDFRVWERGSGETLACGTGACAAVVAGVLGDWCDRRVRVHLRGGDLDIEWTDDAHGGHVLMTGPAVESFRGEFTPA